MVIIKIFSINGLSNNNDSDIANNRINDRFIAYTTCMMLVGVNASVNASK